MTELDKIADSFGVSVPVFKITLDGSGDLRFDLKNKYQVPDSEDPVYKLVAETYNESLNKNKRRFERSHDCARAFGGMMSTIRQVTINASPLKNPKQTRLYKWLSEYNSVYHNPSSVGFIALYRYIMNNGIEETRDNTNPHAKNVLAVLELMREKYENS